MLQLPSIFSIPNMFQRTLDPHRQNSTWKTIQSITFLCILFKRKFCKDKFVLALSKIPQQYVSPQFYCAFFCFFSVNFLFCLHASILSNFRFQWHFNCRINGTLQCNGIIHANQQLNHTIRMLFDKINIITLEVSHVWCYNFFKKYQNKRTLWASFNNCCEAHFLFQNICQFLLNIFAEFENRLLIFRCDILLLMMHQQQPKNGIFKF